MIKIELVIVGILATLAVVGCWYDTHIVDEGGVK